MSKNFFVSGIEAIMYQWKVTFLIVSIDCTKMEKDRTKKEMTRNHNFPLPHKSTNFPLKWHRESQPNENHCMNRKSIIQRLT